MTTGAFQPIRHRATRPALPPDEAPRPSATGGLLQAPKPTLPARLLPPQGTTESDASFARRIWETLS